MQYENNLFDTTLPRPEATHRTERMAHAFGTYYLTRSRGEALNTQRVLDSATSFYEVGQGRDELRTSPQVRGRPTAAHKAVPARSTTRED
ncbi:hypothetical protein ACFYU9_25635 [Streptomyces sp. NPDC004327]|uniref:hypothetical protein n=1 Tax=Streptomyces sp. NPDC004327 TaxID=3364699 RepID=UPI003682AD04